MRIYKYNELSKSEIKKLTLRPAINFDNAFNIVNPILSDIKLNGESAAIKYAKEIDGFTGTEIKATKDEFDKAEANLDPQVKQALIEAFENITKFHEKQVPVPYQMETMPGISCSREFRPIENVGLYVPGGNTVLPSTMLMLGIPAKIAGCKKIVACSPTKGSEINAPLLFAAKLCGVDEFYKVGGAQAIGLMAYGSENIPKANKIFGPGNQYVTAAKLAVSIDPYGAAIDMPAGPSEVLVIADENANPAYVASDLLSQAEHGSDSQVVLIALSHRIVASVNNEVAAQLKNLPRKQFAEDSLKSSFTLIVDNIQQAVEFSNLYAPEHLILNIKNAEKYAKNIVNAGSVFLGQFSPESVGDYASGTNHSLPTSGFSRSFGGVTVESFLKSVTFQQLSYNGLKSISKTVTTLAELESLQAHKNAVTLRIENESRNN